MADSDDRDETISSASMPDFGDNVDIATFSQILEMDESEDSHDFSKPLVVGFFEQARETFDKIETALDAKDLDELSKLGHFLKGSSATLGFTKVKDSCQLIQQYGHKLNPDSSPQPNEDVCLEHIADALKHAKADMIELEKLMTSYFGSSPADST